MTKRAIRALAAASLLLLIATPPSHALAADGISDGQWYHAFLNTPQAHKITKGKGIVVAVIDSGVDASHPDLKGSVLAGADFTDQGPGDGWTDTNGHGTGMASLIAGHGRIRGVAPEAKILPIRTSTGSVGMGGIGRGIEWAVEQGADIISISQAGDVGHPTERQEVERALRAGVIIVAGAGNLPHHQQVAYPAAYPGVLAVSGVDAKGTFSVKSASGPQVGIAAPSEHISTARPGERWSVGTGTSDATALVAGAAALVKARYPDLPASEIVRRLTATAIDKGAKGHDPKYGHGVLNIVGALTADLPQPSATADSPAPAQSTGSPTTMPRPSGLPGWLFVVIGSVGCLATALVVAGVFFLIRRRTRENDLRR